MAFLRILIAVFFIARYAMETPLAAQVPKDNFRACKNIRHCVDIVSRHKPDSFDYNVLVADFRRFGPRGVDTLITLAEGTDEDKSVNAIGLLSRGAFRMTPNQTARLTKLWMAAPTPDLATLLHHVNTPDAHAAIVSTLTVADPDVQTLSRQIIGKWDVADITLTSDMETTLLESIKKHPTSALVRLVAQNESQAAKAALKSVLGSGDTAATQTAYQALYVRDPKTAFGALVETLFTLEDSNFDAALALSDLIATRHISRSDGFYLNFARDIALDAKIGVMGRITGLNAVITSDAHTRPDLPSNPVLTRSFSVLVEQLPDLSPTHIDFGLMKANSPTEGAAWLTPLMMYFADLTRPYAADFVAGLGEFDLPVTKDFILNAFDTLAPPDVQAALVHSAIKLNTAQKQVQIWATSHPLTSVRLAAQRALLGEDYTSDVSAYIAENMRAKYCVHPPVDFRDKAKQLPYFELGNLVSGERLYRFWLTSAADMKAGWLAGFDTRKGEGALLYFDGQSGAGERLFDAPIKAILPIQKLPLGQYATTFWIVTDATDVTPARVYIAHQTQVGFVINPVVVLPHASQAITHEVGGDLIISFVPLPAKGRDKAAQNAKLGAPNNFMFNPPLRITREGTMTRACEGAAMRASTLGGP